MADKKPEPGLHEYAGGWMTERKGTDLPPFLKFALPVIGLCCIVYLIVYMNGEVTHATRGSLVQQFNAATHSSSAFMYMVAALILVFLVILARFILSGPEHEK
jgi:ABC-type branched-subunit amino acid transport system permease subunit